VAILRDALVGYSCFAAGPADRPPAPAKVAVAARDRAGDTAFAELYALHGRRIHRFLADLLGDRALASAAPVPPARGPAIDDTAVDVALDGAPARGPAYAPVTIALFSDFECPYCVKAEATLRALEAAYPRQVRIAFRHRPLPMHEHARLAAKASLAAEAQGRFWEYHDLLVAHRDALDRASLEGCARTAGLDLARFGRDIDDPRFEARITADETPAAKLHVEGTPTAFVNGRRIVGAQPIAVYRAAVDRALASK
jgi:protein-disulfide isomerase